MSAQIPNEIEEEIGPRSGGNLTKTIHRLGRLRGEGE